MGNCVRQVHPWRHSSHTREKKRPHIFMSIFLERNNRAEHCYLAQVGSARLMRRERESGTGRRGAWKTLHPSHVRNEMNEGRCFTTVDRFPIDFTIVWIALTQSLPAIYSLRRPFFSLVPGEPHSFYTCSCLMRCNRGTCEEVDLILEWNFIHYFQSSIFSAVRKHWIRVRHWIDGRALRSLAAFLSRAVVRQTKQRQITAIVDGVIELIVLSIFDLFSLTH